MLLSIIILKQIPKILMTPQESFWNNGTISLKIEHFRKIRNIPNHIDPYIKEIVFKKDRNIGN